MINHNLLQVTLNHFSQVSQNTYIVNPSIPILYFGDEKAYRSSALKVITVGKNPSLNEFLQKGTSTYDIYYRFPNFNGSNYTSVWNEYFRKESLYQWFSAFEPILNGMGCSYYSDNDFVNKVLHTDICSPFATDPTWSKLDNNFRKLLFNQGFQIWKGLLKDLKPDVILVSIPKALFINHINKSVGNPIYTITMKKDNKPRSKPYYIYFQEINLNGESVKIIFGQAANKPFGTVLNKDKPKIGREILCRV